jgi:hypothetical protein
MVITLSVCSFVYALFYAIIMISNTNVNYIEDIVSLNIQKLKETDFELNQEDSPIVDRSYHIQHVE